MATQTAQILIQIRGAIKAATNVMKLERAVDKLGDELGEAGRKAVTAAAGIAIFGTALGAITLATPAILSGLGAATVAAVAFGTAVGGIAAAVGVMGFAATQRFQETVGVAGSAAAQLKTQALELRSAFFESTAKGSDAVLGGLVPLLQGVQGLVERLSPAFTAVGQAMGDALRWLGPAIGELAPELAAMLKSTTGAFQPLAQIGLTLVSIFARVATAAMPYVIDALNALIPLLGKVQGAITGGAIESAFGVLGAVFQNLKTFVQGVADVLGPVLVPAAQKVGAAFSGIAGPAGTLFGSILAGAVQLASGVLPLIADAIRGLAPLFEKLVASGALEKIGQGLATGVRAAVGWVKQLISALMPMKPFVTNVLLPFAKGIAIGIIGAIRAAIPVIRLIATALGWIGTKLAPLKGTFQTVGTIIGTVFAGGILKAIAIAGKVGGVVTSIIGWLGRLAGPVTAVVGVFASGFGAVRSAVSSAATWIGEKVGGIITFFSGLGGKIGSALASVGSVLTAPFRAAFGAIAGLWNSTLGKINFKIPGWVPGIGGKGFGFPTIQGFAAGGPVAGGTPGRDSVPALLMPGEHVLTAREVQGAGGHVGVFGLRAALAGNAPALAAGGPTPGAHSLAGSIRMPDRVIHTYVQIDRRTVATAVTREGDLQEARNA